MPASDAHLTLTSVSLRLVALRTVMLLGLGATVAVVHFWVGIVLPLWPMAAAGIALALLNLWVYWRVRRGVMVTEVGIFARLLADTGALTLLLYYTGGSANPFVSLYLLPLVIAAVVLPRRYVFTLAVLTVGCYSGLMFWHLPLSVHHFRLHVIGMWCNFVLSAGLIVFFVVRMAAALRAREQELAAERERALRNEHIVALGTLAAGAAHELATPLSTMAVLSRELEVEVEPEQVADVQCLREQVDACKLTLSRLRHYGGDAAASEQEPFPLDALLQRIVDDWRLLRPAVPVTCHWDGRVPAPAARRDESFDQMLTNLINNAATASHDGIDIRGSLADDELVVKINDTGTGVAADITALAARAAQPGTSANENRRGMGLMLASASIERLGGRIQWFDRPGGGVCTLVALPLQSLAPA